MKKTILFIVLTAGLYSCKKTSSNTENTNTSTNLLLGKWNYQQDSVNIYNKGKVNSQVTKFNGTEYMQFNSDGTGKNAETTFTYSLSGKNLNLNFAAYTINNIPHAAEVQTANILQLSATKLYILYDFTSKDTNNLLNGNSVYVSLNK